VPTGLSGVIAVAAAGNKGLALVAAGSHAPVIERPPQTQTAETGSPVYLHVSADGALPLAYQWFFDSTNAVNGGTNSVLVLPNLQPAQAGAYMVVVSNSFGAVTSAPVMLSIIPPIPRRTVPAINLTSDIGSLLNLNYADTTGPDAGWKPLDAVTVTTTPQLYLDLSDPLPSSRLYRFWQSSVPNQPPTLELRLATEIQLTGPIASRVRIDYINAVGPTDAWVTLDTVTLTNTTQSVFDTTMFGQPRRLYRLLQVP